MDLRSSELARRPDRSAIAAPLPDHDGEQILAGLAMARGGLDEQAGQPRPRLGVRADRTVPRARIAAPYAARRDDEHRVRTERRDAVHRGAVRVAEPRTAVAQRDRARPGARGDHDRAGVAGAAPGDRPGA